MKKTISLFAIMAIIGPNAAICQWSTNGNNIFNSNTGFVGIGSNSPSTLLFVGKNMTEPTITVRNLGGTGGATYTMTDDASGANWKFKATNTGGFKIRDHANLLDVFVIEANSAANAIYIKSGGTVGIGTSSPENLALVDISSTNKGVLFPRMSQEQIAAIPSPADGLLAYCTTDSKLYAFVASANCWKEIMLGADLNESPFSCGSSITIDHSAGNVAPVTKTVTYGTVTDIPGEPSKCWITSNLGADHQATAVNDATEASAGWYWQFNRMQGYKYDGTTRTPNTTWITSISENSNWIAPNDPCALELGSDWRLPTITEWTNVDAGGTWTIWNDPWSSDLKIHGAGYIQYNNGVLIHRGTYGTYWSSSHLMDPYGHAQYLSPDYCDPDYSYKASGFSVRCLKD
jgi:hypothetical protein